MELRLALADRHRVVLEHGFASRAEAETRMKDLMFDWDTVVPMARFVYRVCRSWRWFGRKLPTMTSELAPDSGDEWEDEPDSAMYD
jgi:hypothetical protein